MNGMTNAEGRALYAIVMRRAREISIAAGSKNLVPGVVRDAAREVWAELSVAQSFESWWRDVHTSGTQPGPHQPRRDDPINRRAKYRELAMRHDVLPPDAMLDELLHAGKNTIGSIRSRLKHEGFVFENIPGGAFRVVKRPEPPPPKSAPAPTQLTLDEPASSAPEPPPPCSAPPVYDLLREMYVVLVRMSAALEVIAAAWK